MRGLVGDVLNAEQSLLLFDCNNDRVPHSDITLVHSLAKYSAGFGGLSHLWGAALLGFLLEGETGVGNLPPFVQSPQTVGDANLRNWLALRNVAISIEAELMAYYAGVE